MIDLWPDDIKDNTSVRAPVTILKEQGVLLGKRTSNIVEGLVAQSALTSQDHFVYNFLIFAPVLGNYSYQLLRISHSIDFYPLEIEADESVLEELPPETKDEGGKLVADSQDRFIEILRAIFATERVRRVIGAILAQSSVSI